MWVVDWSSLAACRTTDPDELFVQGTAQLRAKEVCTGCQVRTECLADALDNRVEFGVWGGMTEQERRALLLRRPTVSSWRRLLQTARTEYEITTQSFEDEFEQLFRELLHRLISFLVTAGARLADAEDAVQMAFIELARVWRSVEHPRSWLRKVSFRMWTKVLTKNKFDDLVSEFPEGVSHEQVDEIIGQSQVVQVLKQLPPLQQAVMAFEYDGCTPSETADAMGMPAVNVRQNLHRARANLAKVLQQKGIH
ncbi:sigma-70 family RNA polymerase sigma factor [Streptomyces sp. NPDC102402]|uniref:Transcriptional regulator WhiB n=1 Tax=Streptomyces mutomycini TaxID=284036 RepID=A0ABW0B5P6_9ACTN|nr:Transcriptional regulator WhiB4 [Streptomyces sp. ADI97-07]